MATLNARIRIRRGTLSAWNTANPTPKLGELCIVTDGTVAALGVTWYKAKLGDGTTAWADLPFMGFGDGAAMEALSGLSTQMNGWTLGEFSTDTGMLTITKDETDYTIPLGTP